MGSSALLSLVDTAMVGWLGNAELAGVGLGSFASWIYLGFFQGLTIAVQALVSRRVGQGRIDEAGASLNAALLLLAIVAPSSAVILWVATPSLFALLNNDPAVLAAGVPYLRWVIAQSLFTGAIYAFNGFWNGIGRSRMYIAPLVVMHVTNAVLAYALIFGHFGLPAMGTEGAGLATALASVVGCALYFVLAHRHARPFGFMRARPTRDEFGAVMRLAVPGGLQQLFDTLALTLMYRIVGSIGTIELAAYAVLINLVGLVGLPAFALGSAGAALVGQALGRGNIDDASRWAWDVLRVGAIGLALIGAPFWLVPDLLLSIWLHEDHRNRCRANADAHSGRDDRLQRSGLHACGDAEWCRRRAPGHLGESDYAVVLAAAWGLAAGSGAGRRVAGRVVYAPVWIPCAAIGDLCVDLANATLGARAVVNRAGYTMRAIHRWGRSRCIHHGLEGDRP